MLIDIRQVCEYHFAYATYVNLSGGAHRRLQHPQRFRVSNPYRELFQAPGAAGFVAACAVARLALPMIGIGIITMLSQVRGAYTPVSYTHLPASGIGTRRKRHRRA